MQTVDEQPETIHLYVVREEIPKPSFAPIILSVIALLLLVAVCVVVPSEQPVTRISIRVPAVLLPIRTFSATVAVIPTGVRVYPATTAHGVLTITNGSVIAQTIPQGFRLGNVITDTSVFVPAGSANGYGYATVAAHALIYGKKGNLLTYAIDYVEGAAIYIRNLTLFTGGSDSYSVKYVTAQDKLTVLIKARATLTLQINGLHYPCTEYVNNKKPYVNIYVTWHCQFVTYNLPPYMRISSIRILGKNLLIAVTFTPRQQRQGMK